MVDGVSEHCIVCFLKGLADGLHVCLLCQVRDTFDLLFCGWWHDDCEDLALLWRSALSKVMKRIEVIFVPEPKTQKVCYQHVGQVHFRESAICHQRQPYTGLLRIQKAIRWQVEQRQASHVINYGLRFVP